MDPHSAPRLDGFGGFWDIMGEDVFKVITMFFEQGWLPTNFNSNFVVLIPKVPKADTITQYRPIAFANFLFKVIPKILLDRLSSIAARIISPNQTTFIKGRKIVENLGLASECFNLLDNKCFEGNVGIKFDVIKAFDTIEWQFLLQVLDQFGFSRKFTGWIYILLKAAKLSILINGVPYGFFSCSRARRSLFSFAFLLSRRSFK
ncbi:hypothetical protein L1049_014843 [Liquidambar formosana]|uniref:Reverse transcriptase domain-containing protein n=1 Tax=Liquidambar formosana TaxID=63359 RepID=A0AAP0RX21_LIQFO